MPPRLIEPCPPYTKVVSDFYDWRVINGIPAQHAGVDKSQTKDGKPMPTGTPFIASFVGGSRVHFAGWGDNNTGNMVILRQGLWEARGMHLRDVVVSGGQAAPEEMLLGHCDNTGLSTGTHLHFDVSAATKEEALLVQPDPVLAYGRWRVDPQRLLMQEDTFMAALTEDEQKELLSKTRDVYQILTDKEPDMEGNMVPRWSLWSGGYRVDTDDADPAPGNQPRFSVMQADIKAIKTKLGA